MFCIMLLLQPLLQTPVTPFSWDAKKWSVSWEELEKGGFRYKYVSAEKKYKSQIQGYHIAQAFVITGLFVFFSTLC